MFSVTLISEQFSNKLSLILFSFLGNFIDDIVQHPEHPEKAPIPNDAILSGIVKLPVKPKQP